jgi:hypothetical protein
VARQRLGVDSYSLRLQGWSAFELCDYAARLGLDNVHLSERRNLASLDPGYLRELRAHAEGHGLGIEIGMGSFDRFAESFRAEPRSSARRSCAASWAARPTAPARRRSTSTSPSARAC